VELKEFRAELLNDVETRAESEADYALLAFVAEAGQRLAEAEIVENLAPLHFRGAGKLRRKLGLDGFDLDDADDSVALAIAQFSGDSADSPRMNPTEARRLLGVLEAFLDEAVAGDFTQGREESTQEYALAVDLRNRGRTPSRYRLFLLTDYQLTDQTKEFPSSSLNGVPIDYHVWDVRRFWEANESTQGREPLEIDLCEWNRDGLSALRISGESGFQTYLAAVPGAMLADLYHRYGSRLLESNVRAYLSARGKINKGIQTTVLSQPQMFLAYNNGITATATSVRTAPSGAIEAITDLQIVNGGQTTASLFYVRRDTRGTPTSLSDVHVQMKLVVVDPEAAVELVPNISRYANSQNRVSEADFFSNSAFHVRMEDLSRRVMAPQLPGRQYQNKWYYERTRGQYQNERSKLTGAQQKQFELTYPRSQVITKTDAAKYEVSWGQKPHLVSAGAQKNFMAFAEAIAKRWNDAPDAFNDEYFRDLVAKAILFNELRFVVAKQDWYQQGYLANIIAYTMSKMAHEVGRQTPGERMNFRGIWNRQSTPPAVLAEGVAIARRALGVLTWANRPVQNVTEWAKREDAWKLFRDEPLELSSEFRSTLLSDMEVGSLQSSARARQKLDTGIQMQTAVLQTPADEWSNLESFSLTHRLGTEAQRGILAQLKAGRLVPTDRQVVAIVDLVNVAKSRGYKPLDPAWQ
jgi:hypothetical protein